MVVRLLVSMFHHILNFRYSKHINITYFIGFKLFLLAINFNILSFSNIFSNLISILKRGGIIVMKQ